MLTWRKPKTLENTLLSYKHFDFLKLFNEKIMFLQQNVPRERQIAENFGFRMMSSTRNIGIGKAMRQMISEMNSDYIIFLENDWILTNNNFQKEIFDKIKYFENGDLDFYKLRSRRNPGNPLYSIWLRGQEIWPENEKDHLSECIHWTENPDIIWPEDIKKIEDFYTYSSKRGCYTNNPFICKREWFIEKLFPIMEASEGRENEVDIRHWWSEQNFKIGQGEGLFTHNDLRC